MSIKQIHYNIDNISKEKANINLIFGEKSNGKSYQVKHKKAVLPYLELLEKLEKEKIVGDSFKNDERFILLRRWKEDISTLWVEQYFADVDVEKLTKGKYNCISVYRKVLYLSKYEVETGKTTRGEKIGYVMALSTEQHYSGGSYLDVKRIIFEEFMERGNYVKGEREPELLMILYSTIDRKRGTTELWLVGNTISRVCPYINAWGLDDIFRTIKQGEIKTKTIKNENNDVKIAIEYCKASGGLQMTIGTASTMVDSGEWQTQPQPHLPESRKNYKCRLRVAFYYKHFTFIGELLTNKKGEFCWFIFPKYDKIKEKTIVFSDVVNISPYWQRDIYNCNFRNEKLVKLFKDTFRETNIFFSDDLCGTDFKQCIDFSIRR